MGQGGEDGDEDADADIGRPEGFLAEFAVGETAPVVADAEVALFQTTCFGFAAVVKGDLFGMVAHTQEGGAVVGFSVLAVDVEVFEFAADEVGNQGADDGINQSNPDEVAVYGDVASADVEGLHRRRGVHNTATNALNLAILLMKERNSPMLLSASR